MDGKEKAEMKHLEVALAPFMRVAESIGISEALRKYPEKEQPTLTAQLDRYEELLKKRYKELVDKAGKRGPLSLTPAENDECFRVQRIRATIQSLQQHDVQIAQKQPAQKGRPPKLTA